jgi:hypothetical protein
VDRLLQVPKAVGHEKNSEPMRASDLKLTEAALNILGASDLEGTSHGHLDDVQVEAVGRHALTLPLADESLNRVAALTASIEETEDEMAKLAKGGQHEGVQGLRPGI